MIRDIQTSVDKVNYGNSYYYTMDLTIILNMMFICFPGEDSLSFLVSSLNEFCHSKYNEEKWL